MNKLLIISYDAVGDNQFTELMRYPNFNRLVEQSAVVRQVKSVFLTNTYPVHTSVVTGKHPYEHGLINNTDTFPTRHPRWWYDEHRIHARTLWQATHEKKLSVAAVMWPVTGGSRAIKYHIPETLAQPGENQILTNLKNGSKWLQIKLYLRHRHFLKDHKKALQPGLDRLAAASMTDIIRKKHPDLALMHLTSYDWLCHANGLESPHIQDAFQALDESLGKLIDAAGKDTNIILFSDHAQLPAETMVLPNELLYELGYLKKQNNIYQVGPFWFECCGGSAFMKGKALKPEDINKIRRGVESLDGFKRFLTREEMRLCGRLGDPFGFCVKPGYGTHNYAVNEKANHGYPLDYPDYDVFYLGSGPAFQSGITVNGGSLLDIAPLASTIMGLSMPGIKPVRKELLK